MYQSGGASMPARNSNSGCFKTQQVYTTVMKKASAMVALAALAGVVGLGGCGEEIPEPETPPLDQ